MPYYTTENQKVYSYDTIPFAGREMESAGFILFYGEYTLTITHSNAALHTCMTAQVSNAFHLAPII
jgi:hypothetical protein